MLKIIECPRDAMQGIKDIIPTEQKIRYINKLLKVGFDTIDFGSFVSPRAIPQMADTATVVENLNLTGTSSKLLAIIANVRGANDATSWPQITYLGYPFSISETFQQRNTNRGIDSAYEDLQTIQELCNKTGKTLVTYISMGFGNPYNDPWNIDIVDEWTEKIRAAGVKIISLADTVGSADNNDISKIFTNLTNKYPDIEFGAHFHARPEDSIEKIRVAYENGCRRFDSAAMGFGGCPMAKDDLVGNIATEDLIRFFNEEGIPHHLDATAWNEALAEATTIFKRF